MRFARINCTQQTGARRPPQQADPLQPGQSARKRAPYRTFSRAWAFCPHWAIVASLVATAKLNGVEPLAWLTDVLKRMVSGRAKAHELKRLLPWTWKAERLAAAVDA